MDNSPDDERRTAMNVLAPPRRIDSSYAEAHQWLIAVAAQNDRQAMSFFRDEPLLRCGEVKNLLAFGGSGLGALFGSCT